MATVVALVFLTVCLTNVVRAIVAPGVINVFAAVLGVFSIGYFQLPIFFIELTPMRSLDPEIVATVAWMALLFHLCVLAGLEFARSRLHNIPPLRLGAIDRTMTANWWVTTAVAATVYLTYILTVETTSYAAENVEAYYADRSAFAGIIAFLAGLALTVIAVNLALAVRDRRRGAVLTGLALLLVIELILLGRGQRLIFIAPLFSVFAAFAAQRQYRAAAVGSLIGVVALVLVSPFAVVLREARAADRSVTASTVDFDLGATPGSALLQSLVDRADGLEVATVLKDHFDRRGGGMNARYYYSVLVIPVPRFLYPTKPQILSDTGEAGGEASVLAWQLRKGNSLGSLTAFGFIIAYREGGWPMVIVNGLAAGAMFGFLLLSFARGGFVAQCFFCIAFVSWSVAKVPPSLWEALVNVLTYLPVLAGLLLLNTLLSLRATKSSGAPLSAPSPASS